MLTSGRVPKLDRPTHFIYDFPIVGELLKQMAEIAGKSQEKFGKRRGLLGALPFVNKCTLLIIARLFTK